eukprot:291375-Hanusia_phi.AAC.2
MQDAIGSSETIAWTQPLPCRHRQSSQGEGGGGVETARDLQPECFSAGQLMPRVALAQTVVDRTKSACSRARRCGRRTARDSPEVVSCLLRHECAVLSFDVEGREQTIKERDCSLRVADSAASANYPTPRRFYRQLNAKKST